MSPHAGSTHHRVRTGSRRGRPGSDPRTDLQVTVIDLGLKLEASRLLAVGQLSSTESHEWDGEAVGLISEQPVATRIKGLPEKRSYGSDFPFRDVGQLANLDATADTNRSVVSGAYGGFSNLWGAQVMPFTSATFDQWSVSGPDMEYHYRAILREIPSAQRRMIWPSSSRFSSRLTPPDSLGAHSADDQPVQRPS